MNILKLQGEDVFNKQYLETLRNNHNILNSNFISCKYIYIVKLPESQSIAADKLKSWLNVATEKDDKASNNSIFITPRIGTISPWSSKALDIANVCDLPIENIAVAKEVKIKNNQPCELMHIPELYDRLTESLLYSESDLNKLFSSVADKKTFQSVDIASDGISALAVINAELGLALSSAEMEYLVLAYKSNNCNPTDAELMMFAQANSEHCRHKIFRSEFTINSKLHSESLFDKIKSTYSNYSDGVLSAYHDNSAVISGSYGNRFYRNNGVYSSNSEDINILIKVETHNHPTAIAPYPGAATGSGGEIRDEGATGRGARPKAGLCGFSVSNLHLEAPAFNYDKPNNIASPQDIMLAGPIGAARYNNEFGRPNIAGYFREFEQIVESVRYGYHKPIMLAGGFGNIKSNHIDKKALPDGSLIIVLGGPSMLIGLGGGAQSSLDSGQSSRDLDFASVQRDNAEMQRRCQEVIDACWQLNADNPILSIHDVGAGGLANAIPELVHDADKGAYIELRKIICADVNLSPLEIWCNESQERYVLAIAPENAKKIQAMARRERAPLAIVGKVTAEKQLSLYDSEFDNYPVNIPMQLLFGNTPKGERIVTTQDNQLSAFDHSEIALDAAISKVLSHSTVADKKFLITIGDRSVGGHVVRDQLVGPWQVACADVGVTSSDYEGCTGEAMAVGERAPVAIIDSAKAARIALMEAITNIMAADITSLTDIKVSANWMAACGYKDEDAKLFAAVTAVTDLAKALDICIPVGKDSLSMRSQWQNGNNTKKEVVSPVSLVVSAFAPVTNINKTLTPLLCCEQSEDLLLLIDLSDGSNNLGGSILSQCYKNIGNKAPDICDLTTIKNIFKLLATLKSKNLIHAYHDRSDGGLLATVCEMMFVSHRGATLDISDTDVLQYICNEGPGIVLQISKDKLPEIRALALESHVDSKLIVIGNSNLDDKLTITANKTTLFSQERYKLQETWSKPSYILQARRDDSDCALEEYKQIANTTYPGLAVKLTYEPEAPYINRNVKPKIAILREQGINGHNEMAFAFSKVGFEAHDVHLQDILTGSQSLANFNGLAVCGGFSYGDVLGAGRGFAQIILNNSLAEKEFSAYFNRDTTFTLGVCNGCQMLANLKDLIPGSENWPKFLANRSLQFEARLVMAKVLASNSLLFNAMADSYMPVVVSNGEGRSSFTNAAQASQAHSQSLVTLQYVDNYGVASQEYPANPSGSDAAVAGLCSKDGRVNIMMPHPERTFRIEQFSYLPRDYCYDVSPWLKMFSNAYAWLN